MLRHIKSGMLLFSILSMILGLALLLLPELTVPVLCYALGALVVLCGLTNFVRYFTAKSGLRSATGLLLGLPTVAVGVLALVRASESAESFEWVMPLLFGLMLAADGTVRVQSAFGLAKRKGQKWWVVLLLGVVSLAFGVLLAVSPMLNYRNVDLFLLSGIFLLAEGVLNLCCTIYIAMEFHALDRVDAVKAELTPAEPAPEPEYVTPEPAPEPPAEPAAQTEPVLEAPVTEPAAPQPAAETDAAPSEPAEAEPVTTAE